MILEQIFGKKKFTDSEKQIADFIEANPRVVINLSLDEFSAKCYVSQASIIRFCKKLGAKGFAEFKIQLASSLSSFAADAQNIHVDVPIAPDADGSKIAGNFPEPFCTDPKNGSPAAGSSGLKKSRPAFIRSRSGSYLRTRRISHPGPGFSFITSFSGSESVPPSNPETDSRKRNVCVPPPGSIRQPW